MARTSAVTPDHFTTFGDLLKYLRRRAGLTQRELSIAAGYSESQISRFEQDHRAPDEATLAARFVPALHIESEREWVKRLLELGAASRAGEPTAETPPPPSHNLPIQLTSFIGREQEIVDIQQHLSPLSRFTGEGPGVRARGGEAGEGARLLTLTGPGGCGKTRLALQAASSLLEVFPHGVWLIELAPLADSALVPQTVASTLGVKEEPGHPMLTTLTNHLRGQQMLLVLDNCEHLIDACAQFAEAVLQACPTLHLLATSREALSITSEIVLSVSSLSMPDTHQSFAVETLFEYEAIRLFVERAASALPGFTLTDDNAVAVTQTCQRLDGIPLAIELAAARVKLLRVEQIATRLDDRFRLLTSPTRMALPRHQTLHVAIEWSHDLLAEPECILLRRLSVFAGGWTLAAAESVASDEVTSGGVTSDATTPPVTHHLLLATTDVLDLLTQLVNKSLFIAERAQGEEARYRMLETIRQYALEKLMASGEAEMVQQRHAEYYLRESWARRSNPLLIWLDYIELEHDNFRAALLWSQQIKTGAELGLQLVFAVWWFWFSRGYWGEGIGWLDRAVAYPQAEQYPKLKAYVLDALGFMLSLQNDYTAAQTHVAESLRLFQELGNTQGIALALYRQGMIARLQGDTITARLQLDESLTIFRKLENKHMIAETLNPLGDVLVMQEDALGAQIVLDESLALFREEGDLNGIGWALNHLGYVAQLRGEYKQAIQLHEESQSVFRKIGEHHLGVPRSHLGLGETRLAQGNMALATPHFLEGLVIFRYLGHQEGVSWCLAGLAGVAAMDEEPERAAWLWGAAEALRQSIGARPAPAARATHERLMAEVRAQLGEAAFNVKWAEGQAASLASAIKLALQS